jgi:molybdate transport system substrate-binding protein
MSAPPRADRIRAVTAVLLLLALIGCSSPPPGEEITVAAAASLRRTLPDLVAAWGPDRPTVIATYGASGTLRQQVQAGAPIDAVLFAAEAPVEALIEAGFVDRASSRTLATNDLVLIGPEDGPPTLRFKDLPTLPADARIAIGEPGAVPAGQYAKDALEALGVWEGVEGRVVFGGDVAMVLAYARRGEVDAAVVYGTEAKGIDGIRILDRVDWPGAPTPRVVGAAVVGSEHRAAAERFLDFVGSAGGRGVLRENGFGLP